MKLLLDENLPQQLRHEIVGHDCATVAYLGWSGIANGELLTRAASSGFSALVTKDANLQYEQNLTNLPLAVVVLRAPTNDIEDIRPLLPALLKALANLSANQVTIVHRRRMNPLSLLPFFQRLDRREQHQHIHQQTVANCREEANFYRKEYRDRCAPTCAAGNEQACRAGKHVAETVDHRVACVAQCGGHRTIAINNKRSVLEHLPGSLQRDRQPELPAPIPRGGNPSDQKE